MNEHNEEFDNGQNWDIYLHPLARGLDKYDRIIGLRDQVKTLYGSMRLTLRKMGSDPQGNIAELDDVAKRYNTTMTLYISAVREGMTHLQDAESRAKFEEYIERLDARRNATVDGWLDIKRSLEKPAPGAPGAPSGGTGG